LKSGREWDVEAGFLTLTVVSTLPLLCALASLVGCPPPPKAAPSTVTRGSDIEAVGVYEVHTVNVIQRSGVAPVQSALTSWLRENPGIDVIAFDVIDEKIEGRDLQVRHLVILAEPKDEQ